MDVESALELADELVFAENEKHLNDLQRQIFRGAWEGKSYPEIAETCFRDAEYIKDVGYELWKLLSEVLGEKITKGNFRAALERIWRARQSGKLSSPQGLAVDRVQQSALEPNFVERESTITNSHQDWGAALDVSIFWGRTDELTTLEQWIVEEHCRLLAIWGIAGIGKSLLARKLADNIKDKFEYVIWRSLNHAPLVQDILADLIEFFSNKQETVLPDATVSGTSRLIEYLQAHPCLVILDGVETLLITGQLAGRYREGYQEYGKLFRQIGQLKHQSCIMLTSSEKSREIASLAGKSSPIRVYKLEGLKKDAAQNILREQGLIEEEEWRSLIEHYRGNPLYLKIVSTLIIEVFNGKASEFIKENTIFIGQIHEVLEQLFERLSNLEIDVMCKLAITNKPVSINRLRELISAPLSSSQLMEVLESLMLRSMIEKVTECSELLYGVQPVVRKYVINRFCQA